MKRTIHDVPIYLAYYILPIISFILIISGVDRSFFNYEIVWLLIWPLVLLFTNIKIISSWILNCICIVLVLISLKYLLPIISVDIITWRVLLIDIKWLYYLLQALLWINFIGKPNVETFYSAGRNFSIIYILYFLVMIAINGEYRRYPLLSESNYDCFLFLISFCFIQEARGKKTDYIFFIVATILSGSKTGIISLLALIFYPLYQKSHYKIVYWFFLPLLLLGYIYIYFINRGISTPENIDRIIFFAQFIEYIKGSDWTSILFGTFAGTPMHFSYVLPAFKWYIVNFENINGITGCFPFYFHSTYIRLSIVWGIPAVLMLIIWMLRLLCKTKNTSLQSFVILFLLQSVSLSSLSLTTVSFMFFIAFLSSYSNR